MNDSVVSFKVDMRQFTETLHRAVLMSSSAAKDVVNRKAYYVAVNAAFACKVADKGRIATELGKIGEEAGRTKTGRVSKSAKRRQDVLVEDSFAGRIVNARRRDFAGPDFMLHGSALVEAARALIKNRQAAVGFIASGFVRAARQLRRFAKFPKRETPPGIRIIPDGPGGRGTPAVAAGGIFGSGKMSATIEHDGVTGGGRFQAKGMSFNPGPIALAALQSAMAKEESSMVEHMRQGIGEALKKAGAM